MRNAACVARLIDTVHMGIESSIGVWESDGLIVDPGPAVTIPHVLEQLGVDFEPRAILLTHIHLDHAGGTGTLLRHFPGTPVYVHELGAPHMIDPSRLWSSASRIYGEEQMLDMWGETLPVPEEVVTTLSGGERVEGMDVLYAPGHAAHHVVYIDDDGSAFCGDAAGARTPPGELILMPTPPPEVDVEAWLRTIEAIADRRPERVRMTHCGEAAPALEHLDKATASLRLTAGWAEAGDREAFAARLDELIDSQPEAAAQRLRHAVPPDHVWLGLERYWRKRRESAAD
jgi:glyoxylase-like metal-dependent hydrolase (beta-lactamase superfamily II)